MKRIGLITLLLLSNICSASNLEFSQIILIDASVAFTKTVPAGKIWKIESAPVSLTSGTGLYKSMIQINGKGCVLHDYSSGQVMNHLPIWLPEGTVISEYSCAAPNFPTCSGLLSIIEYNVVP